MTINAKPERNNEDQEDGKEGCVSVMSISHITSLTDEAVTVSSGSQNGLKKRKQQERKVERKICIEEGCTSFVRAFNRCKRHGGLKRCKIGGCSRNSQSWGLCIR